METNDSGQLQRRLHPIPEVAEYLGGIGRSTVYELIKSDHLQIVKIGARAFITRESLEAYVNRLKSESEANK